MDRILIEANIILLTTDEGGRETPMKSGVYRSLLRFDGDDRDFGFELNLETPTGWLSPGEPSAARLSLWAVDCVPELSLGHAFEIREGLRVVGHGTVTKGPTPGNVEYRTAKLEKE